MYKEMIISIITIIVILILNFITESYTGETVSKLTDKLTDLRTSILQKSNSHEEIENKINTISKEWDRRYNLLAYYLEHDELEKVETNLAALHGEIETEEYAEAISELDKTVFILKHIEQKNQFDLKNIF